MLGPDRLHSVERGPHVSAEDVVEGAIIEGFHAERPSDRDPEAERAKKGFPSWTSNRRVERSGAVPEG